MRFAIAVLMTVFLVAAVFPQDATQPGAPDATQSPPQTTDQPPAPAPDQSPTPDQSPAPDQAPAPAAAVEPAPAPAPEPAAAALPASGAAQSGFKFSGGVNLGSDVLLTGAGGSAETWTRLGFQPDISFGKIGVGLDLTFHFLLYPDPDTSIKLYQGDWVPKNGKSVLDIYLPKIMYVRYGLKGQDPFFAKLGSIDDLSLGDGFIMSNYANTLYLPEQRIFGLDLGLDGALFNFPYAGIEMLTGNLARLDVLGTRVYARPLVDTSIPILKNMQAGVSLVADRNPYVKGGTVLEAGSAAAVYAYGADIMVPILGGAAFPLAAFTDFAIDPNKTWGWMLGAGGRVISVFTYGAQLRVLQKGFIPSYFDGSYDAFSAVRYDLMQLTPGTGTFVGWLASLGTSLLSDKLVFNASLDGPFSIGPSVADPSTADQSQYPHLRSILALEQLGAFPFYFSASYEKYSLGAGSGFLQDLVDPTNAVIGFDVNYKTGASVLTLAYNAKWNPSSGQFDVTSSLQASMKF